MILEEIESSLIKGEMEKEIDRKREWQRMVYIRMRKREI